MLSLWRVPEKHRKYFESRNFMWIDIESKERSDCGNELGEEVALYLKRYGVRLYRKKPMAEINEQEVGK